MCNAESNMMRSQTLAERQALGGAGPNSGSGVFTVITGGGGAGSYTGKPIRYRFYDSSAASNNDPRANAPLPSARIGKITPKAGVVEDGYRNYRWKTIKDYKWYEQIIIWFSI